MGRKFMLLVGLFVLFALPVLHAEPEKAPAGVNATKDTDGDGLPDWWEMKYFGNAGKFNRFNGKLDPDGDKVTTAEEYKLGTNPNDKKVDKNHDGVADDWAKYWKSKNPSADMSAKADPDKDGASNLEEYKGGTNPLDPKSSPKKEEKISQKHPTPSMMGVQNNIDKSIPDNHMIRPNVFKYNDPIGDDKGPGYYSYPTNPVYVSGAFDMTSFTVDASSKDNVVFKISVNADLKQDWGMAADFDVQYFQIYIDEDGVPGSGHVKCIPGINVFFNPAQAWDKVVLVSPQPQSRVQIEVDVKAKSFADDVVIPQKISGRGRTIVAVVSKKALGADKDTDFSKWAWQVVSQSNEGFPDPEDVLTRNVNEYRGLHRFGGGSDYWGDPELMDILVWPAMGSKAEAQDQFKILNVWESYPDPKLDIHAVLPLVKNDEKAQWMPKGGYQAFAKELAAKIKPPVQKDKYVSDNFDLFGKLFTRWNWNYDPSKENVIRNSLELGIDGKMFTDLIDFYIRFELDNWENTKWTTWANSTPGQTALAIQSRRVSLVNPFPTVDLITIGNYELDYDGWVLGSAWYPDRDKFMGVFVDGSIEGLGSYSLTVHYPLQWIGFEFGHGQSSLYDLVYGAKAIITAIPGIKIKAVAAYYSDYEMNPLSTDPKSLILRGDNFAAKANADVKLPGGFLLKMLAAFTKTGENPDFYRLEKDSETDIDGNKKSGTIKESGMSDGFPIFNKDGSTNFSVNGVAAVATLKNDALFGSPLGILLEGFFIDPHFTSFTAARGDTSDLSGSFGGVSGTADVLSMQGNQSVHRAPQAADFVSSIPIPGLPTEFIEKDPVTGLNTIGWVNDNWEGVAAEGWRGGTIQTKYASGVLKMQLEGSLILNGSIVSNDQQFSFFSKEATNNLLTASPYTFYIPLNKLARIRAYFVSTYSIFDFLKGAEITPAIMFESIMTTSPITPIGTSGVESSINLSYNSMYVSPMLSIGLQWNKTLKSIFTYRLEMGKYNANLKWLGSGAFTDVSSKNFLRHRIIVQTYYALPVGYYKIRGEYWYEGAQKDFPGRTPFGAYFVAEWEYGF